MIRELKVLQADIYGSTTQEEDETKLMRLLKQTQPSVKARGTQTDLSRFMPKIVPRYTQDWPAYDWAKTNQVQLFRTLLDELLLIGLKDIKQYRGGRRGYSLRDKIFCMCMKVYYRSALRKSKSILRDLKNMHFIEKVPSYKSICNFFNDERLCKILDDLIWYSSLPLAPYETTCAIDATGMSLLNYKQWLKFDYSKPKGIKKDWRKIHALMGCKTNIFLAAYVTAGNVSDITMLEKVVGNRTLPFNFQDFVADKGYLSRKAYDFITSLGIEPLIPFRKDSRGLAKGCPTWRRMFYEFQNNREECLRRYGQRSNIECGFHMVKRHFDSKLMSKNPIANENEAKIKFLCHNLLVLMQEMKELGLEVDFNSEINRISNEHGRPAVSEQNLDTSNPCKNDFNCVS